MSTEPVSISNVAQPLVSVITPAFNEEASIAQCIESVQAQSYQNWEHIIVNNRSTDRTLEIAQRYAAKDPRIRVHTNETFIGAIENQNTGLRLISPNSKYCKLVLADDWIYSDCLSAMVKLAEQNPSVGIVGAYGFEGKHVLWMGLTYPHTVVKGRDISRLNLLGMPYIFGSPTTVLFRSDLVRARHDFYDPSNPHTDYHVCLDLLQHCDFGFVFQILTFSTKRPESRATFSTLYNTIPLGNLAAVVEYGPLYLTPEELRARLKVRSRDYYLHLATNVLRLREKEFWDYHREKLAALGLRLDHWQLSKAVCSEIWRNLLQPAPAAKKAFSWWARALLRTPAKLFGSGDKKQASLRGSL